MVVKLELVTVAANELPDSVPAAAVTVMSVLPSKATPFIFFAAANFVAVAALPSNAPVNAVEVTEVNPAIVVAEDPKGMAVVPTVIALLANWPLVMPAVLLISVVVMVPSAIFAEVIDPSATPAADAFKST